MLRKHYLIGMYVFYMYQNSIYLGKYFILIVSLILKYAYSSASLVL